MANSRMTRAAAVISSMLSPFKRKPIINAPIWASVASPDIMLRITSCI